MAKWFLCELEKPDAPFKISDLVTCVLDGGCRSWFTLIEEKYPKLICQWCGAHSVNLLMQALGELDGIAELIDECKEVIKFFRNRSLMRFLVRRDAGKIPIMWVQTRFGTTFISMERLGELRVEVAKIVVSEEWTHYYSKQGKDSRDKCDIVRVLVLSPSFWAKIDKTTELLVPVFGVLRRFDGDDATLGIIYHQMAKLKGLLRSWEATKFDPVKGIAAFDSTGGHTLIGKSGTTATGRDKAASAGKNAEDMLDFRWLEMAPSDTARGQLQEAAYALNPWYLMYVDCGESPRSLSLSLSHTHTHTHTPGMKSMLSRGGRMSRHFTSTVQTCFQVSKRFLRASTRIMRRNC